MHDNLKSQDSVTPPTRLHLSWQTWLALLALGVSLWVIVVYANLLLQIIWILFGAFLLSVAVRPITDVLARWRVPRGLTVLAVYLAAMGLLATLGSLLVPVVGTEIAMFRANGPNLLNKALSHLSTLPFLGQLVSSLSIPTQNLVQDASTVFPAFLNTVTGAGDVTLSLLVVLVLAYFFSTDGDLGTQLTESFVPARYRPQILTLVRRLRFRLTRWVWAQVAIAVYFAVTFGLGATLLGIPFAFTIALVGGVLEIVPYLGGTVALMLAILSALTVNPWLALWVIGLSILIAEVQSHIVAPMFYGRALHLHPALVLVVLLIGVKVQGIIGVFFAVPVTVVLITIWQEVQAVSAASQLEVVKSEMS